MKRAKTACSATQFVLRKAQVCCRMVNARQIGGWADPAGGCQITDSTAVAAVARQQSMYDWGTRD